MNWQEASSFSTRLLLESRWSRTIYSYQTAAILLMLEEELNPEQKKEIETLMRNAPNWKQRIAGKSLPMEKFAVKKTARFFAQGNTLVLPAFELLYLWNMFKVLGKKFEMVQNVYKEIERTLRKLNQAKVKTEYDADNKALVLLLKAACLRLMKSPLQAQECLMEVIALEKNIKEDNYLIPYSVVELAILSEQQNDHVKAMSLLEDAKKNYTGYSLESRLHFKIHAFQLYLNEQKGTNSHNHVPETTV
ncbi:Tetratricopeptide repeat protein 39B [Gryllus bimaculatus]|nr:Tetratricopeptide repeat protein 39B [Gryllus bimaculatus]